jgi:hypothetical protein
MGITELIERLGRTVFEAPFGATAEASDSPEVAEIRFAILDEIQTKMQRAGGKHIFPYDLVRIQIRGVGDAQSAIFERDFFRNFFEQEVKRSLSKSHCRYPDDLRVEVHVTKTLAAGHKWLSIETLAQEIKEDEAPVARRIGKLTVVAGAANKPEILLQKARVNVGRTVDVFRAQGPSRRNDLAFSEETAINRTVSREHAHIVYDKAADEYRIYNDRWYKRGGKTEGACGLWIVRDGLGQEVHRDTRGTKLLPGDEIHFGKAIVKFQMK